MKNQIKETTDFLLKRITEKPTIGIITGTGMGDIINHIDIINEMPYEQIPNFVVSTVESHPGKLVYGKLEGKYVIVMLGRFHYYEGYSAQQITFPIRVMQELGMEYLILMNAAGSLNPNYKKGSIMLIDDHINLIPDNPLRGTDFVPRFPDMSGPYDIQMNEELWLYDISFSHSLIIPVHRGIYVAVPGPNLETKAEYRYLRTIGADAVGMSTVPEVIVANQCGINCMAMSVLTDECDPDNLKPVNISEIIEISRQVEPKLIILIKKILKYL